MLLLVFGHSLQDFPRRHSLTISPSVGGGSVFISSVVVSVPVVFVTISPFPVGGASIFISSVVISISVVSVTTSPSVGGGSIFITSVVLYVPATAFHCGPFRGPLHVSILIHKRAVVIAIASAKQRHTDLMFLLV